MMNRVEIVHPPSDQVVSAIKEALERFGEDRPTAEISLYRQNSVSVRVRIVDASFASLNKVERNRLAWSYLERLPEEIQTDISLLLLLTPEEKASSYASFDFDNALPSRL